MPPDSAKYLWDAREASLKAMRFVRGRSFDAYMADEILRSAVERQLEIAGEALSQLRRIDPSTASSIPNLAQAVALRNILIHAYATVDDRLVWGVVEVHLAGLTESLSALLPSADEA